MLENYQTFLCKHFGYCRGFMTMSCSIPLLEIENTEKLFTHLNMKDTHRFQFFRVRTVSSCTWEIFGQITAVLENSSQQKQVPRVLHFSVFFFGLFHVDLVDTTHRFAIGFDDLMTHEMLNHFHLGCLIYCSSVD